MMTVGDEVCVPIRVDVDIVAARQQGRRLATDLGFSSSQQALIATAISELARNIVEYAGGGEIVLRRVQDGHRRGMTVVARDEGPGIPDVQLAMQDGYSTGGSLGLGLPGTRRLMDEFDLHTQPGAGTRVTATKWTR
jgi:serine/threonine-protein kinase RsbT